MDEEQARAALANIYRGIVLGKEADSFWRQSAMDILRQIGIGPDPALANRLRERLREAENEEQ